MNEREANIHLARVYIHQARLTKHRNWAFVLLMWAANCRKRAPKNNTIGQLDLFA